ncbi:50S ribosomal protein L24 [Patescibacteria group bacterium]|nr:50S ribosomal protein L24 [Patescibacteria group bacterium]
MKIKKSDKVKIITGKDKGKEGKVLEVFPEERKLVVEGLNLVVKHMRPRRDGEKGQRIQFPAPLRVSNVMLTCNKCNKLTRVGYKILENGKKVRMCKKCKEVIE